MAHHINKLNDVQLEKEKLILTQIEMLNAWEATVGTAIEKHAAAMVEFNASLQFFQENSGLSPSVTPSYRRAWRDYQSEQKDIIYNDPATDIAAQHKEFVIKIEANEKTKNIISIRAVRRLWKLRPDASQIYCVSQGGELITNTNSIILIS